MWQDVPEEFEKESVNALPVLTPKGGKFKDVLNPEGPENILIEADNYHALSVLAYTHAGRISLIYIDPPYNTGAKDWKYNNAFVEADDPYRHSQTLLFAKETE
jgi:adenine-specific DNA-methyltransferase